MERPIEEVRRDLEWGKISLEGARKDYGVIATRENESILIDEAGSLSLREEMNSMRPTKEAFFDRGPGYALLANGQASAEVDFL